MMVRNRILFNRVIYCLQAPLKRRMNVECHQLSWSSHVRMHILIVFVSG